MNFLDDATEAPLDSHHNQHHSTTSDHLRDDVSSISNSTLSPHHPRSGLPSFHSRTSRQYIWDEHEEKDENYSSPSLFKPSYHSTHRGGTSISSNSSSLKSNIEEVQKKVEKMKNELKIKNISIKELQSELSRLTVVRGQYLPASSTS